VIGNTPYIELIKSLSSFGMVSEAEGIVENDRERITAIVLKGSIANHAGHRDAGGATLKIVEANNPTGETELIVVCQLLDTIIVACPQLPEEPWNRNAVLSNTIREDVLAWLISSLPPYPIGEDRRDV
jgi:hypothetical protein